MNRKKNDESKDRKSSKIPRKWINTRQAAEIIGVSKAYVTVLAKTEKIVCRKFDARTNEYSRKSVEKYAEIMRRTKTKGRPSINEMKERKKASVVD